LLTATDAPRVVGYLQRCAANLGLAPLQLEFKSAGMAEAEAFGLRGEEVILFYGTPELLEESWGDPIKVIALHEIGHIVNGDPQDRERARAIGIGLIVLIGLVLCGLAALAFNALLDIDRPNTMAELNPTTIVGSMLGIIWRLAGMLLLYGIIWTGLVSVRELYADRRVASWGLAGALEQMLRPPKTDHRVVPVELWKRWWQQVVARVEWIWQFHPSKELRRQVLIDPVRLFRISPNLPFVTGLLLSILLVNLFSPVTEIFRIFSTFLSHSFWRNLAPIAATLNLGTFGVFLLVVGGLSYLLVSTLGAQVQREAIADLMEGKFLTWGYGRLWWPAFLLALGLEAGFVVAPFNPGTASSLDAGVLAFWLAGFTGLTWLWLSYVRALTRFTLGVHVGAELPRILHVLVNGSAAALLTAFYCPAFFVRMTQAFWIQRAVQVGSGAEPQEYFVYMYVGTGVVLAVAALVLYVVWAAASLGVISLRLLRWTYRCPDCKSPVNLGFALGRSCGNCGEPLASWAYAGEARDPGL
jgi:hypothetical protein